jgi:hypothetical protein
MPAIRPPEIAQENRMTSSTSGSDVTSASQTTTRIVVALFRDRAGSESAIRDLKTAGFTDDQIGLALPERLENRELMTPVDESVEGAATGAVGGSLVGGLIGLLGSLLIPGVGPVVVGGVLATALAGAGIGAATGGLLGALVNMGVPQSDAEHFEKGFRAGGILVTVNAGPRTAQALAIIQQHGADLGLSHHLIAAENRSEAQNRRSMASDLSYSGPERRAAAS